MPSTKLSVADTFRSELSELETVTRSFERADLSSLPLRELKEMTYQICITRRRLESLRLDAQEQPRTPEQLAEFFSEPLKIGRLDDPLRLSDRQDEEAHEPLRIGSFRDF